MRRLLKCAAQSLAGMGVALMLGCVVVQAAPAQSVKPDMKPDTIYGKVTAVGGKPIDGALIEARGSQPSRIGRGMSDAYGNFRLIIADSSTSYSVTAKAIGFAPWSGQVARDRRIRWQFGRSPDSAATAAAVAPPTGRVMPVRIELHEGGTPADWPPPRGQGTMTRKQLGTADEFSVSIAIGEIEVVGSPTDEINYRLLARSPLVSTRENAISSADSFVPYRGTTLAFNEFSSGGGLTVPDGPVVVRLEIPRNLKRLQLAIQLQGVVRVTGFDGELSIRNEKGPVTLEKIGGPALVEARDGMITATVTRLAANGLDFMARNGDISLTLPPDVRASFSVDVRDGDIKADYTERRVDQGDKVLVGGVNYDAFWSKSWRWRTDPTLAGSPIKLTALKGNVTIVRAAIHFRLGTPF